jgi:hypothetical protein
VNKKKQKNFDFFSLREAAAVAKYHGLKEQKFLVLFFKKEPLPCFSQEFFV